MAFLISPGTNVDGESRRRRIFGERTRNFEAVHHSHCAIEPSRIRLCLKMGANEETGPLCMTAPDHRADAVDSCFQACLLHSFDEPMPRRHVLGRIREPMHPGLI